MTSHTEWHSPQSDTEFYSVQVAFINLVLALHSERVDETLPSYIMRRTLLYFTYISALPEMILPRF